jgi:hypothetical protein
MVKEMGIPYLLYTFVIALNPDKTITAVNPEEGLMEIKAGSIVLAMGCRERSRNALLIPGARGAGIMTAGTAQRYLNLDGYPIQLAAPLTDWGKLYEQIIKTVLNGTWEDAETEVGAEDRSLSYWWGLSGGCADIIYSEKKIPPRTLDLVNFLKEQMIKGQYHPISGTLRFQDGTEQDFEDNFDILNLINMDKLYENIHGYIPGVSEIKQEAVELAKAQGIKADDTASD